MSTCHNQVYIRNFALMSVDMQFSCTLHTLLILHDFLFRLTKDGKSENIQMGLHRPKR